MDTNQLSAPARIHTRAVSAALPSDAAQAPAVPVELLGVEEQMKNGDGFWRTCSGCHETEDGRDVGHYPFSNVLNCTLGGGCSECGGIGAIWDNTDYDDKADWIERRERDTEKTIDAIMEQAQVFASAWSLVGGVFDSGNALETAEQEKAALREMLKDAAPVAPAAVAPLLNAPDGEDPMKHGDRSIETSVKRLTEAYCKQQPLPIPDQMALVWRFDIGRLRNDWIRLNAWQESQLADRRPAKSHCQNGGDVCLAGNRDGVCCPEDSCDIDDGIRAAVPQAGAALTDEQRADIQKVIDCLEPDDWCGDESIMAVLNRVLAAHPSDQGNRTPIDGDRNARGN
ncbi:hypothetical protein LMG27952_03105 [Paraburkholderia hiiakae]|uniref:Cytochrome c domain-containing protein n=1 Tax=Paraburkholderia hiiakae TaxID=1081782 RepID=A0ABN7HW31_9BURK|nr:hypothetical protein [Paraburkholderia hiiakae]CAD6536089.1 hypothetical protein LMG27952_03105 [Paraburkholderia hiiakae]